MNLRQGDSLLFHIGIWNYAYHAEQNGLPSPYPGSLSLSVYSVPTPPEPQAGPLRFMMAASQPEMLFELSLESLDGSYSMPLSGSYSTGFVSRDGEYHSVDSYSAGVALSDEIAALLFGEQATGRYSDGAVVRVRNVGSAFTLGYPGLPIQSLLSVSLSGEHFSVGAVPGSVELMTAPEPGTMLLLAAGLAFLATRARTKRRDLG